MSLTTTAEVAAQMQTFWAPMFMKELREKLLLAALVNKDYDGQIKEQGNTVRVSQITAPAGQTRTVGVDADTFTSSQLATQYVDIVADKRFVASFSFQDLVRLQSQIGNQDSEVKAALMYAMEKEINDYLYSLVSPSTSAPDLVLESTASLTSTVLRGVRKKAAQQKWMKNKAWYGLVDPNYWSDLLGEQTLVSSDYVPDAPVVGGMIANQRFGFSMFEDDSRGTEANSYALFFHPDFMHLVTQTEPTFKISDLHALGQFGYKISVDLIGGAKLGIDGNKKHILVKSTA